jgi:alkyl hydroperoxide reductase subunit AhpC
MPTFLNPRRSNAAATQQQQQMGQQRVVGGRWVALVAALLPVDFTAVCFVFRIGSQRGELIWFV